jgi:hypothetical protein
VVGQNGNCAVTRRLSLCEQLPGTGTGEALYCNSASGQAQAVVQHRPGGRVVGELDQQVPDLALQLLGEAAGGHHRLDGRRAEGANDPQTVQARMIAQLDGQDLGVDRGGVHDARGDQPEGPLVEASLHHPGEEPWPGAHADQAVEGDGVAGVGRGLVVGPRAAPQILQAHDAAVAADDHIRVVDGAAAVAVAGQDRGGQRLDRRAASQTYGSPQITPKSASPHSNWSKEVPATSSTGRPSRSLIRSARNRYTGSMFGARKVANRSGPPP